MKCRVHRADGLLVTDFSTETWVLLMAIATMGVGAILNLWATAARTAQHIHELKSRVLALRQRYEEDGDEMHGDVLEV